MAKVFPVYEARSSVGKPCGHQHQTEERAQNCAVNMARREPNKTVTVRRYVGSENGEWETVSHFEYKLSLGEVAEEPTLAEMVDELMS